jgi:hypothetical protein
VVASTSGSSYTSAPGGVYCLYGGPIPFATLTPSSTGYSKPSSSIGIPGAYALPSASAASRGDVVTGISIQQIGQSIAVNSAKGPISSNYVCPSCVVRRTQITHTTRKLVQPACTP